MMKFKIFSKGGCKFHPYMLQAIEIQYKSYIRDHRAVMKGFFCLLLLNDV